MWDHVLACVISRDSLLLIHEAIYNHTTLQEPPAPETAASLRKRCRPRSTYSRYRLLYYYINILPASRRLKPRPASRRLKLRPASRLLHVLARTKDVLRMYLHLHAARPMACVVVVLLLLLVITTLLLMMCS